MIQEEFIISIYNRMTERSRRQIRPTQRFIEEIGNEPVKLRSLDIEEQKEIVKNQ